MYNVKDKENNLKALNLEMLNKTLSMFEYSGLPDSLPARELEKLLQMGGCCLIAKHDGELYAFKGSLGGEVDVYGNYTTFTVINTYLKLNKQYNLIKDECVLFNNDDLRIGLLPLFNRYNSALVENNINIDLWGINTRQQKLISASDDKTKASAELYLKKIAGGELSIIGDSAFLENLKTHESNANGTNVREFIELTQYLKSNLYNAVGLSSQFNMKKERLISSEVDLGEDSLFTLVYTMMKNRLTAINDINEMFNLNIAVGFGSVWSLKNKKLVDDVVDGAGAGAGADVDGAGVDGAGADGAGAGAGADVDGDIEGATGHELEKARLVRPSPNNSKGDIQTEQAQEQTQRIDEEPERERGEGQGLEPEPEPEPLPELDEEE